MDESRVGLRPGRGPRKVVDAEGAVLSVPPDWDLLPPGDASLTRAVKALGATWAVEEKRGRKTFSRGVWAPAEHIRKAREEVEARREDPAHQRRLEASRQRRAREQEEYVGEFEMAVREFLRFHPRHEAVARELAARVTRHATPVGSGTVARTERIPVEERAEAAVIAWMRHQTTAYDETSVARVKGARRELRRELANRSRQLLQRYRRGEEPERDCPLARALSVKMEDRPPSPPSHPSVPSVPSPPPPPPSVAVAKLIAPRTPEEEAQQALYLKVRARLTRGH